MATQKVSLSDHFATQSGNKRQKLRGLLDLPPELWSGICLFALIEDEPNKLMWTYSMHKPHEIVLCTTHAPPAIMNTCRVIRQEAVDLYYKNNDFAVGNLGVAEYAVWRWLCAHKHHMRSVTIEDSYWRCELLARQLNLTIEDHEDFTGVTTELVVDGRVTGRSEIIVRVLGMIDAQMPVDAEDTLPALPEWKAGS